MLNKTLKLIRERCSPEFPSSIFYAYKQQEEEREGRASTGWETMLSAIVSAGFQIVGTWPMRTEGSVRLNAQSANALASSVVLVCRPRPNDAPTATRSEFSNALEKELPMALDQLTQEGHIAPTDLAQAAIGPGMQIYSRYSRVETISGEPVSVREALVAINRAIADYDERQEGDLDSESRFCLDWLKQHGYEEGPYGDAETLARAKKCRYRQVADVDGLLTAEGGRVKLLPLDAFSDSEQLTLGDTTAWEGCFRMAYHLNREDGGASKAQRLSAEKWGATSNPSSDWHASSTTTTTARGTPRTLLSSITSSQSGNALGRRWRTTNNSTFPFNALRDENQSPLAVD